MFPAMSRLVLVASMSLLANVASVPSAQAATSYDCPAASSTRLLTFTLLGDPSTETRLWVYRATPTRTIICLHLPYLLGGFVAVGGMAIVLDGVGSVTVPSVTPGTDTTKCTFQLVNVSDPLSLTISSGQNTICIRALGTATTLTFNLGPIVGTPGVEVWRNGSGVLDFFFCAHLYALYQVDGSYWDDYAQCYYPASRIV